MVVVVSVAVIVVWMAIVGTESWYDFSGRPVRMSAIEFYSGRQVDHHY